jgi:predicted acylesterase/phospholipase RssA
MADVADDTPVVRALVLQGGGALGAFALGAVRVLYAERGWRPDVISGVSIGAITAALLARPKGGDPLAALEAFWAAVTVEAAWWPGPLQRYASTFGNPHFFTPRTDVWAAAGWTSLYSTEPLKRTLAGLVDEAALADPAARPRILVTATDIEAGEIETFDSADPKSTGGGMTLDHILASGSLPPSFPMTRIGDKAYWDGGLFDNTPLSDVLKLFKHTDHGGEDREIVVVNLFANTGAIPTDFAGVSQRVLDLTFANKSQSDLDLLLQFNPVAALLKTIREKPEWEALRKEKVFTDADKGYIEVPEVKAITRKGATANGAWTDFSPAGIAALAKEGADAARDGIDHPLVSGGKALR